MAGFNMDDYITVPERIVAFKERYPEGSLQSELIRLDDSIVVMKAYAYRTPDDPRPGVGHSSLAIPGKTTFTKDSELENCETSAFGRALAALGFEVKRGLASGEEVRSKQPSPRTARPPAQSAYRREELATLLHEKHLDSNALERFATMVGIPKGERATNEQMDRLIAAITDGLEVIDAPQDGERDTLGGVTNAEIRPAATQQPPDQGVTVVGTGRAGDGSPPSGTPARPANRTVEEAIADAESKSKEKV